MKTKFFSTFLILPMLLSGCTINTLLKKPSFKKCSNEVSQEDFYASFKDQYKLHNILGDDVILDVDSILSGYEYVVQENTLSSSNNKQIFKITRTNDVEYEIKYDKDSKLGHVDSNTKMNRTENYHNTYSCTDKSEISNKIQFAQNEADVVGVNEIEKEYYMHMKDATVDKVMHSMFTNSMPNSFFDYILPYFSDPTHNVTELTKTYIDKNVYTLVYTNSFDNQSEETEKVEDIAIKETIKMQFVLQKEPSFAYLHEVKETKKCLVDSATSLKGEITTYSLKDYAKGQIKLKQVRMRAVDYTNYIKSDAIVL